MMFEFKNQSLAVDSEMAQAVKTNMFKIFVIAKVYSFYFWILFYQVKEKYVCMLQMYILTV